MPEKKKKNVVVEAVSYLTSSLISQRLETVQVDSICSQDSCPSRFLSAPSMADGMATLFYIALWYVLFIETHRPFLFCFIHSL